MDPTLRIHDAIISLENRVNYLETMLQVVADETHNIKEFIKSTKPGGGSKPGGVEFEHPYWGWRKDDST